MSVSHILEKYLGPKGKEAGEKWDSMDSTSKGLVGILAAVDIIMKGVALSTLSRTPKDQIRGPKWVWAAVIPAVNTFGWAAFYLFGRLKK